MLKPNRLFWTNMLMAVKTFKRKGRFAFTKNLGRSTVLLAISLLISTQFHLTAEALTSERLLTSALSKLQATQPGQIVHSSYYLFNRMPPQEFEPHDPYHKPYRELWITNEIQETWIEVGPESKIVRWRTELFDKEGRLLQDLMFDGKNETDYFPLEGKASKFSMQAETYQDEQAVMIAHLLKHTKTSPTQTEGFDGKSVLSVYAEAVPLRSPQIDTESALLSLSSPFAADLNPNSFVNRMDFDLATHLPIGDGTLVIERSGIEHLISYRSLLQKENLTLETNEKEALFSQAIPSQAFVEDMDLSEHVQILAGLDTIVKHVNYPIYITEDNNMLKLATASLAIPDANYSPPGYMQGITFAPQQGPGVSTIYANHDNSIVVSVIQGRTPEMKVVLKQTLPTWVRAEQTNMPLGRQQVVGWTLHSPETAHRRYILEASDTMLYIDSQGLSNEQISEFLRTFTVLGTAQASSKLFLPMIRNN